MITTGLLRAAIGCTVDLAERFAGPLSEACALFEINTPRRLAFFFANIGHESADLAKQRESMDYSADRLVAVFGAHRITQAQANEYGRQAGRRADQVAIANLVYGGAWGAKNLGNTQPGDGWTFRAAGPIGTTGRANFRELRPTLLLAGYSDVPDFEAEPDRLTESRWGAAAAGHYWASRGCNALADAGEFMGVCRAINLGDAKSSGTPNGMPDRMARLARAQAALADVGQIDTLPKPVENPAEIGHVTCAPPGEADIVMPAAPAQEKPMTPLLIGLASSLIDIFTPLAKEKINKEIGRHTDNPEVAGQITAGIIETAKTLTGKADPIQAVAAASANPTIMAQVETSALDALAALAPVLDKLATYDAQAWAAEEASRDAASARARGDEFDMTRTLLFGALGVIGVLIALVGFIVVVQVFKNDTADTATWSALTGLIGWATGVGTTIYAYRFGTTKNSSAKDVVIGQLSQRGK